MQSSNGQTSPPPDRSKPKRHTGSSLTPVERQKIIRLLGDGQSCRSIARQLHHSHSVVEAVAKQEWAQVSARKQVLAAKHERAAVLALDELLDRLETKPSEIPTPVLNIIGGTSTDKALLIRGENMLTLHHIHSFDLSDDDIIAFAVSRSQKRTKIAKTAQVIEAESPPAIPLLTETTARKKISLPKVVDK